MLLRKWLTVSLVCGMSAGLNGVAHAQTMDPSTTTLGKSPIRIKFGGFVPGTGETRKAIKDLYLGGGLTYDFARTAPDSAILSGYLDVNGADNADTTFPARITSIGFGPQFRYYLNKHSAPLKFYVGSGAGAYIIDAEHEYLQDYKLYTKENTFVKFGAKILGGVEFKSGSFAEMSFTPGSAAVANCAHYR
jgi:hypothetical protein